LFGEDCKREGPRALTPGPSFINPAREGGLTIASQSLPKRASNVKREVLEMKWKVDNGKLIMIGVFLFTSVISFKPMSFESPSPVTITTAQACDEFHGDNNCTCQQSIFSPCCPWWEPSKCPPPIKQAIKEAAYRASDWLYDAGFVLGSIATPTCIGAAVGGGLACAASLPTSALAFALSRSADKIVRDPFDPDYYQVYDAPWPSIDSFDPPLIYTDNGYLNNMLWYAQAIEQMADMAYVSANRVTTCQSIGDGCAQWQQDYVNYALWMMGAYFQGYSDEATALAQEVANDGDCCGVASEINDMAWMAADTAWRFQQ
jgi:hypothetical protein